MNSTLRSSRDGVDAIPSPPRPTTASGLNRRPAARGECISSTPFARPIPILAAISRASRTVASSPTSAAPASFVPASFVPAAVSLAFFAIAPPNISITFARSILPSLPSVVSSSWMRREPSSADDADSSSERRSPVGPWVLQCGPAREVHSYSGSSPFLASVATERINFCGGFVGGFAGVVSRVSLAGAGVVHSGIFVRGFVAHLSRHGHVNVRQDPRRVVVLDVQQRRALALLLLWRRLLHRRGLLARGRRGRRGLRRFLRRNRPTAGSGLC